MKRVRLLLAAGMLLAAFYLVSSNSSRVPVNALRSAGSAAHPKLVKVMPLPEGELCQWMPVSSSAPPTAFQQRQGTPAAAVTDAAAAAKRRAIRKIYDTYPAFSSVAVDVTNNEVVVTDENLFQILVYDRMSNTPAAGSFTEPKRILGGASTKIEFQCGLYIDPKSGDIYAVNNDTVDTLVVFNRQQRGNVAPASELRTPHGTFGIAVAEERNEMFLSLQHSNSVVVFDKNARNRDVPLRLLQGPETGLADPHGIALDTRRGLLYTANHGSFRQLSRDTGDITQTGMYQGTFSAAGTWPAERRVAGTGKSFPSSITVHPIEAQGNARPLRVLTGPRTRLNWPTGLAVDEATGELFVANDVGDEILVFAPDAQGDAAPIRILKGVRTGLKNPTGIALDPKNRELWVANFGNHTATVYKMDAVGNTPPLRVIRSGPTDEPALMIGNPGGVAFDSKRQEILVPN